MANKKSQTKSTAPKGQKFLIFLAILAALAGAVFLFYFIASYNNHRTTQQKSVELPGLKLYSVQESDFNNVYSLYVNYPKIDEQAFDDAVYDVANDAKRDFLKDVAGMVPSDHPRYDLNVSYSINYYNDQFLSVDVITHRGMDGTVKTTERTVLYDRKAHKLVALNDLFNNGTDYLRALSDQARSKLKDVLGAAYDQKQAETGTAPNADNFKQFTVDTERHLVLVFDSGQVAAESAGIVRVTLDTNGLANVLNKDYVNNLLQVATVKLDPAPKPAAQPSTPATGPVPQADPSGVDCGKAKCIALTFDDGPSYTTPQLLDTLKANNVKATFFELGIQAQKYPSITKRVVAEGHVIGNHTWDHKNLLAMSLTDARGEVTRAADTIQAAGGVRPGLIRAPYGSVNNALAKALNAAFINWNVDPNDWKDRDANIVHDRVMSHAKPGAIILSHDIYQTTVDAYKRIIPELIKQGYTLVTVPQLLGFGKEVAPGIYFNR